MVVHVVSISTSIVPAIKTTPFDNKMCHIWQVVFNCAGKVTNNIDYSVFRYVVIKARWSHILLSVVIKINLHSGSIHFCGYSVPLNQFDSKIYMQINRGVTIYCIISVSRYSQPRYIYIGFEICVS